MPRRECIFWNIFSKLLNQKSSYYFLNYIPTNHCVFITVLRKFLWGKTFLHKRFYRSKKPKNQFCPSMVNHGATRTANCGLMKDGYDRVRMTEHVSLQIVHLSLSRIRTALLSMLFTSHNFNTFKLHVRILRFPYLVHMNQM